MPLSSVEKARLSAENLSVVHDLLDDLRKSSQLTFSEQDLARLGVDVHAISPFDPSFLQSQSFFQPLSAKELAEYAIDDDSLDSGAVVNLDLKDVEPGENLERPEMEFEAADNSMDIFRYLQAKYEYLTTRGCPKTYLVDDLCWSPITSVAVLDKALIATNISARSEEDSFFHPFHGTYGLLAGSRLQKHPAWYPEKLSEWVEEGDPVDPHILLVLINETVGESDKLLLGELGALAQVIYNRLIQPEFKETFQVPVC